MIRPLPIVTSTNAALPLMRLPPSNQPDNSGSLSRGYQAITFTADTDTEFAFPGTAVVSPAASVERELFVALLITSNTGESSAQAIDSFDMPRAIGCEVSSSIRRIEPGT